MPQSAISSLLSKAIAHCAADQIALPGIPVSLLVYLLVTDIIVS